MSLWYFSKIKFLLVSSRKMFLQGHLSIDILEFSMSLYGIPIVSALSDFQYLLKESR